MVKIELLAGALTTESLALEWVNAHRGPVPSILATSELVLPDGRQAACLVIDHVAGGPDSEDGWRRLGRALAALAAMPWDGSDLTIYEATTFGLAHQHRVTELGDPLRRAMAGIED